MICVCRHQALLACCSWLAAANGGWVTAISPWLAVCAIFSSTPRGRVCLDSIRHKENKDKDRDSCKHFQSCNNTFGRLKEMSKQNCKHMTWPSENTAGRSTSIPKMWIIERNSNVVMDRRVCFYICPCSLVSVLPRESALSKIV